MVRNQSSFQNSLVLPLESSNFHARFLAVVCWETKRLFCTDFFNFSESLSSGTNIEDEKKADANADGNKGDDDEEIKTSDDAIVVIDGKEVVVIDGVDVAIKEDGAAPDNEGEEIAADAEDGKDDVDDNADDKDVVGNTATTLILDESMRSSTNFFATVYTMQIMVPVMKLLRWWVYYANNMMWYILLPSSSAVPVAMSLAVAAMATSAPLPYNHP